MTINADLVATKLELTKAAAGMRNPEVATLTAGESLFRFASSRNPRSGATIPPEKWARGAWWFREHDYRTIIQRRQSGQLSLGAVARSAGAVLPSWSLMDVSIKARLLDDVNIYLGKGASQYRDELPTACTSL